LARRAGYYLAERVRAMSGEGTGAGVGEKRPRSEVSVDIGDGHGPCVYRFVVCKTSTARAGKKVNKKIKAKEIVSNGPVRTVDHTVGLLAGESLDSEDDRRSAIARFYKKRARAELAPAAEGTPHAKRERNSPDQFSPVPESEQDHWVWTRDHGHEDRLRSRDWVVPAAIKQRHANELAAKDQEIEELRLQIGRTMLVDSAVALMTSAAVHLEHAPAAQMTKRARAGQLLLESLM
jgi:hypothetical protein